MDKVCVWKKESHVILWESHILYFAECYNKKIFSVFYNKEFKYCPYCGKLIKLIVGV